jgi:hypothetical protein
MISSSVMFSPLCSCSCLRSSAIALAWQALFSLADDAKMPLGKRHFL